MTYPIPDTALNEHIAFLGSAGAGKTWAAKTAVERLFGTAPICIIDPTGAWWGLRLSRDGKFQGLEFLILGGDHGDLPITEHDGEKVATIVHGMMSNVIVDVSSMLLSEQRRFMTSFAEHIFKLNKKPLHLVVDEADGFMPQKPMRDQNIMLNRMDRLVRRGRSRGFRVMLISQRPAVLNKDSLSQVGTLVAMRLRSPQDRAAIGTWIEGQADKKKGKEIVDGLPGMKRGEGWVWSPGHDVLEHVKFPDIMTFDSSADGGAGADGVTVGKMRDLDLGDIRALLGLDDAANVTSITDNGAGSYTVKFKADEQARIEKSAELAGYDRGFRDGNVKGWSEAMKAVGDLVAKIRTDQEAWRREFDAALNEIGKMNTTANRIATVTGIPVAEHFHERSNGFEVHRRETAKMPKAERMILTALAQHGPMDKARLAIMTCYAANGGGFQNAISSLRSKSMIIGTDTIELTNMGKAAAPDHEKMPTGRALVDWWRRNPVLGKAERLILDAVTTNKRPISKIALAEQTGYAVGGGGFSNALSRLRTLGLISGSMEIAASEHLRAS